MLNGISLCMTGVIIIISIVLYINRFKNEILSHFTIIAIVCFLVQVFAPMVWIMRGQTKYKSLEVMEYTPIASLYFVLGYLIFCFFFFAKSPRRDNWIKRQKGENIYSDIKVAHAWLLYLVFFVLYNLYLNMRGRSLLSQLTLGQQGDYSKDIMNSTESNLWFLMVSLNALVCISIVLLFYQKKYRVFVYLCYGVTLLLTISAGYRHLMIDILLAPLMVKSKVKREKTTILRLLLMTVVLYLIVSWVGAMRGVYRTGQGSLHSYESESAFDAFMVNIEVFFPYFAYVNYIPNYGHFAYGGSYIAGILQLIPSILWSGKGKVLSIIKNDSGYRNMLSSMATEGIASNFWCEGFINGGIIGIMLVFGLLGRIVARLRKMQNSECVSDIIIFALSATFMFQVLTRSFQNMLQDAIFLFLPIFMMRIMKRITVGRKRSSEMRI